MSSAHDLLYFFDQFKKLAEEKLQKKNKAKEVAKVVGTGLGGMALGSAAGYGAGKGLEYGSSRLGVPIPRSAVIRYAAPIAGAGLGTAYSLWKARESQEIKDALKDT